MYSIETYSDCTSRQKLILLNTDNKLMGILYTVWLPMTQEAFIHIKTVSQNRYTTTYVPCFLYLLLFNCKYIPKGHNTDLRWHS